MPTRPLLSIAVLAFAVLVACGRSELFEARTESAPDAHVGSRDASRPPPGPDASAPPRADAGRVPDAGPKPAWDAGTCTEVLPWTLTARTLKAVRLAAGNFAKPRLGSSVSLEVDVQLLSGCEELAKVFVTLSPGGATDFVSLNAQAWVQQGGACEPVAPVVTTAVVLPARGMGNRNVVVSDYNTPGEPVRLTYGVEDCAAADCWCGPWSPPGTTQEFHACTTDCDCADGLSCLPAQGANGALWTCKRPCAKHTDCPQSGCTLDSTTAPWVCGSLDACPFPDDCPAGFSCVLRDAPSFCEDQRRAPSSAPCKCDSACPPGQKCVLGFKPTPTCEIPCADDQDCPYDWLTCGTPAYCVPLDD